MFAVDFGEAIALFPIAVAKAEIASATEDCRNFRRLGFMMHPRVLLTVYFIMTVSECNGKTSRRHPCPELVEMLELLRQTHVHRNSGNHRSIPACGERRIRV